MTKAEKKYVVAYTHAQARHFAQSMGWVRSEWEYVNPRNPKPSLAGMYNLIVYNVRAPRYTPIQGEEPAMERLQTELQIMVQSGRIARLNVANLP
jgi:hypothetical protein